MLETNNVLVQGNEADDGGGAMIILGNTVADIERSNLSDNTSRFGGAIFNTADDVSILDSTLSGNTAEITEAESGTTAAKSPSTEAR